MESLTCQILPAYSVLPGTILGRDSDSGVGRQKGVLLLWRVHSGSRASLLAVFALGGILFKLEPVLSSILISNSWPASYLYFFNLFFYWRIPALQCCVSLPSAVSQSTSGAPWAMQQSVTLFLLQFRVEGRREKVCNNEAADRFCNLERNVPGDMD